MCNRNENIIKVYNYNYNYNYNYIFFNLKYQCCNNYSISIKEL